MFSNPDSLGHALMTLGHIAQQVGARLVTARSEALSEAVADAERLAHEAYALGRQHERQGVTPDGDEHQGDNPGGHEHQGDNPADASQDATNSAVPYSRVAEWAKEGRVVQAPAPVGEFVD